MQQEAHTQAYIAHPLSVSYRKNITRLKTRSHPLRVETGAWCGQPHEMRLCTLVQSQNVESEEHLIVG